MFTHRKEQKKQTIVFIYHQKITCKLRENFPSFSLFSFKLVMPMRD